MTEHVKVPGARLGLRPPSGKPTLKASLFLKAIPTVPNAVDHLIGFTYELGRNSEFGTCGPTSLANYIRLVTTALTGTTVGATWDDIKRLYVRQNPDFDERTGAGDQGVDMKTMLADAVKYGFVQDDPTGAAKVLGFAEVNINNPEEVEAVVAIFGGSLLGLDLQTAQNGQLASGVWDFSPSGEWGGHAVCEGGYDASEDEDVITWAQRVKMTRAFVLRQRQEAYVVILGAHLGSREFLDGWNLQQFAQAYADITGRPFPVDIPADPPADPPVDPPVVPPLHEGLASALQAAADDRQVAHWLTQRHHYRDERHVVERVRAILDAFEASQRG